MIDKAALLAPVLDKDTVEVPGLGAVCVRALTRYEAGQIAERTDTDARERLILTYGLVEPALTEAEAGQWMRVATTAQVSAVTMRIGQLSGLLEDSPRATFPGDGDRPAD